ncbi:SGNH/GDSL hydrolase family protein [Actinomadura scrupuli]|uniref:SGNH/GDSL hydrolase family protein n=1 Tax=Actinomadura scrupuli TaxID=559629 RepID=UPI003D98AE89
MTRWRRVRERLGRRGTTALAVTSALVLIAVMAIPFSLGDGPRRCTGRGCLTRPWPGIPSPPRPITPLEAATQGGYVALGDSYSSGEGAYAVTADRAVGNRCHRTSQAYFHLVVQAFRFARGAAFWACSGATTYSVLHGKGGEPPQTDRLSGDTSLVTLSVGGNDAGFSRVLAGCMVRLPFSAGCREQGPAITERLLALRADLRTVLDTVVRRAPAARVLVLGYPRLFSEVSGGSLDNLTVGDQQWLNGQGRVLDELIRQVAADADRRIVAARGKGSVEFVDAYHAFAGHEVGSGEPYVNGLGVDLVNLVAESRSFHPNASGYRHLAQLITAQIKTGPPRPLLQFR